MTHKYGLGLVAAAALAVAASARGQIINEGLSGSGATQPGAARQTDPDDNPKGTNPFAWMVPNVTMPKITMPKLEMPKMPADPLAPVKSSAQKVKDGARKAWEGTKEIFTFGQGREERIASREAPQTMSEWMSQKRPD
ncbi:MAG: hypothetical protein KF688_00360 [Pirellulales bacterium]|nr:hypothetical protein [Pirellulales bacterium]